MDTRLIFRDYLGSIKTDGGTQKAKWERKSRGSDSQEVGLEAAIL